MYVCVLIGPICDVSESVVAFNVNLTSVGRFLPFSSKKLLLETVKSV